MVHELRTFQYLANKYVEELTTETEIAEQDQTEILHKELEEYIKRKLLINITIIGNVRQGKSTTGFTLGNEILQLLHKYKETKENQFTMKNIARDQQEYSKKMRDPNTNHTIIVTDEHNELEEGGENVTIERQLNRVFSDVQAARYVHRISISPREIIDENSDIILEVLATDRTKKTTYCKIYYRLLKAGQIYQQIIGHCIINVAETIKNWEQIQEEFYEHQKLKEKPNKTKEEDDKCSKLALKIQQVAHKDYYVEYMIKKHEKMEMLTKEGIFRPRILDYAECILNVVNKLKNLTKIYNLVTKNTIQNYIKIEFRKQKIPQSIIGEELSTREANGILSLYDAYYKTDSMIKNLNQKKNIKEEDITKKEELITLKKDIKQAIDTQEEELLKYREINRKYNREVQ